MSDNNNNGDNVSFHGEIFTADHGNGLSFSFQSLSVGLSQLPCLCRGKGWTPHGSCSSSSPALLELAICNLDSSHVFHLTSDGEEEDTLELSGSWRNVVDDEKGRYAVGCYFEGYAGVLAWLCTQCSYVEEEEDENIDLSMADRKTGMKTDEKTHKRKTRKKTHRKADEETDDEDGWCSENCSRVGVWTELLEALPGHR